MEFIPETTPSFQSPLHLKPYIDILEKAPGGNLREVFSAPPQHGKTEATLHALIYWLKKYPWRRFVYATYGHQRAKRVARKARLLAERAGIDIAGELCSWLTPEGGSIIWTALNGPITGEPVDGVFIIDDPYKERKDAESVSYRATLEDRFDDVCNTRVHRGASIIVMAARWHQSDLSGFLIKRGWNRTNLKAVCDGMDQHPLDLRSPGEALWEKRKTLTELDKLRLENPFSFASLYQGEPVPRGQKLFHEPFYFDAFPSLPYKTIYGIDLGYTKKKANDSSVCIRIRAYPGYVDSSTKQVIPTRYYVTDVLWERISAPEMGAKIKAMQSSVPGKGYMYTTGPEIGNVEFMNREGAQIVPIPVKSIDKLSRSQTTAKLWNAGLIMISKAQSRGMRQLTGEAEDFTGLNDPEDACIDGLVSAIDGYMANTGELFDPSYNNRLPQQRYT